MFFLDLRNQICHDYSNIFLSLWRADEQIEDVLREVSVLRTSLSLMPFLALMLGSTTAEQDQFVVNMRSTSNVCIVQRTTDRPQLGNQHLGPFGTQAAATAAMCHDRDISFSDPQRCWAVLPDNACDAGDVRDHAPQR